MCASPYLSEDKGGGTPPLEIRDDQGNLHIQDSDSESRFGIEIISIKRNQREYSTCVQTLAAPNCMRALPLTSVADICMMTASTQRKSITRGNHTIHCMVTQGNASLLHVKVQVVLSIILFLFVLVLHVPFFVHGHPIATLGDRHQVLLRACTALVTLVSSDSANQTGGADGVDEDMVVCGEVSDADIVAEVLNNNTQAEDEASGDEEGNSSVVQERPIPKCSRNHGPNSRTQAFLRNWLDTCSILAVGRLGRVAQSVRYFFGERRSAIVFCAVCWSSESGPPGLVLEVNAGELPSIPDILEILLGEPAGISVIRSYSCSFKKTIYFLCTSHKRAFWSQEVCSVSQKVRVLAEPGGTARSELSSELYQKAKFSTRNYAGEFQTNTLETPSKRSECVGEKRKGAQKRATSSPWSLRDNGGETSECLCAQRQVKWGNERDGQQPVLEILGIINFWYVYLDHSQETRCVCMFVRVDTTGRPLTTWNLTKKFIWDRNMVYALIEEYKKRVSEFENPSYKKRRLWSKIAHAMRARGFKMLTDEMCDIKWRNLKKTFKEIYFGKRSTVKWEYYNVLKHIFEKDMSFYSNFGAAHRRLLLSKKTLNKKTLADVMEVEPDSSNSYIIDDSQEGLEEERPICKDDAEHRQSMSLVLVRSITQYLESRQSLVPVLLRLYSARTQRIFLQHGAARIDD
uniref:Myb/SANT-like DNA-binding domain-containing protein n=1 Tax=Timema monikensis TaxID=170555 RepID=A0A7R9EDS4_9NEOP|nr:unnamed protein product [Timema monikensis]